jgi:hydroxymethylbilane synthase
VTDGRITLRALVASLDGTRVIRGERAGPAADAPALGEALGEELLSGGAAEILRELEGR